MQEDQSLTECLQFCNKFHILKILTASNYPIIAKNQERTRTPQRKIQQVRKRNYQTGKKFENVKKPAKNGNATEQRTPQFDYMAEGQQQTPYNSSLKNMIDKLAFGSKTDKQHKQSNLRNNPEQHAHTVFLNSNSKPTNRIPMLQSSSKFQNQQQIIGNKRNNNEYTNFYFDREKVKANEQYFNSSQATFYNEQMSKRPTYQSNFNYKLGYKQDFKETKNNNPNWGYQSPRRNLIYVPVSRSPSPLGNSNSCINLNRQSSKSPRPGQRNRLERPFYEPKVSPLKANLTEEEREHSSINMVVQQRSNIMNQLQMQMHRQFKECTAFEISKDHRTKTHRSATQNLNQKGTLQMQPPVCLQDGLSESISYISQSRTVPKRIAIDMRQAN